MFGPLCDRFARRQLIVTSLTQSARRRLCAAALLAALFSGTAVADESRIALVIATGQVAARDIAPVPACPPSARVVGRQLAGLGFTVVESVDQTRGETAAAIAELARRLRENPGARAVVYACGPIVELEGRAFILPSSAALERPTDVLTQGVLLRSLPDTLVQARVSAGLFAVDAFAETPRLPSLPAPPAEASLGLILSSQANRQGQRTALASALLGELVEPAAAGTDVGILLTRMQARLEAEADRPQHRVEPPGAAAALLPAPPPMAQAAAPATEPAPSDPVTAPRDDPAASAAAPPSAAAAPTPAPPAVAPVTDEIQLSEPERRGIQATLSMLGYYRDRIDGSFGPSTRVAIRRYQREIGEASTGALTAVQAQRLLAGSAWSRRR